MKSSDRIVLNEEEITSLLKRVSTCQLAEADKKIITSIIRIYQQVQFALQETKISISRLCKLFGFKRTEKRSYLTDLARLEEEAARSEEIELMSGETDLSREPAETADSKSLGEKACDNLGLVLSKALGSLKEIKASLKDDKKGHGRLGHKDYTGATIITQEPDDESIKSGDVCPEGCSGRLYAVEPKTTVYLTGHALATAAKYIQARCRCSACGKMFTAKPAAGTPSQKYDEALKANLAIAKNYAGMPFYRLQMLQQMVGVPLPSSTQWQLIESLADDIYPVFYELERLAAQGEIISHDDTVVRILSIIAENKRNEARGGNGKDKDRKGMFTTGIVSQVDEHVIYLFISGRHHSGENMTKLLEKRFPGLTPVIRMADALSCNLSVEFIDILCKCLAHSRRKFYEIYNYFPGECRIMIDALAIVYHHDAITKQDKLTPVERLSYHQVFSAPIMETLKEWLSQKLENKEVEPNSSLGKAMKYTLRHWEGLTRFLYVAGAPLDNNITERALKIPIRSRKNSLFYKTEHGALVGGMLTSIIHTCVMAGENPVDYLISLQKNKSALFKSPQDWLPWSYKETAAIPPPLPPPILSQVA